MTLRPGDAPPPFALADLAGKRVGSDSLAGARLGRALLVDLEPALRRDVRRLQAPRRRLRGKGLKIVAINIDGENLGAAQKAAIREYAAARELPFPVLLDEGLRTFSAWGVMAHPTEVVLDAGGRIAYVLPGYPLSLREELEEAIRKALGVPVAPPREPTTSVRFRAAGGWRCSTTTSAASCSPRATRSRRSRRSGARRPPTPPSSRPPSWSRASRSRSAASPRPSSWRRQVSPEAINRGDLRYLLGGLMLAKGDLDAAERAFRALQERLPAEGWGEWGLGRWRSRAGIAPGRSRCSSEAARAAGRKTPRGRRSCGAISATAGCAARAVPRTRGSSRIFPALGGDSRALPQALRRRDAPRQPAAP